MEVLPNTSVIFLATIVVWLIWLVPSMRRRRQARLVADDVALFVPVVMETASAPKPARQTKQLQETSMERSISDAHTTVEPGPSTGMPAVKPAPLTIRWGRTLLAVVGLFALLTAAIAGALSVVNVVSAGVPFVGLLIFAAVLVTLRSLAVRDRRRKLAAAFRSAMDARESTTAAEASARNRTAAAARPEPALFDRAAGGAPEPAAPAEKPLTAAELRHAALKVAAKGTADAELAHTRTLAEGEIEAETWEPVEVPKPGYITAMKAALADPSPLAIPAVPKSEGTSIKADQAGVGVAQGDVPTVIDGSKAEVSVKPAHSLSNLDDVLQRRRA